jgi:hypothetical protein
LKPWRALLFNLTSAASHPSLILDFGFVILDWYEPLPKSKIGNLKSKIKKALALRPGITPGVPLSVTSKQLVTA